MPKSIEKIKQRWEQKKIILKLKQDIKNEKKQFKSKPSTTKLFITFLFCSCLAIEIFTGIVTWKSMTLAYEVAIQPDFTPLVALISAIVSEVVSFAVQALKSAKENCKGGIVQDIAMREEKNLDEEGEQG